MSERKSKKAKARPMGKSAPKAKTKEQKERKQVADWCKELSSRSTTELRKMIKAKFPNADLPTRMTKQAMCQKLSSDYYETKFHVLLPASLEQLEELDKNIPESFIDPVSMSIMVRPIIVSSGFSYDKKTVDRLWKARGKIPDPTNREELDRNFKMPNKTLAKGIREYFMNSIGVDIDKLNVQEEKEEKEEPDYNEPLSPQRMEVEGEGLDAEDDSAEEDEREEDEDFYNLANLPQEQLERRREQRLRRWERRVGRS